jgi:hypothetical protein
MPAASRGGRRRASRGSADGWGGQPFRLFMKSLDKDQLQAELLVHEPVEDVHPGLLDSKDAPIVTGVHRIKLGISKIKPCGDRR